jgi:hypothetical protein
MRGTFIHSLIFTLIFSLCLHKSSSIKKQNTYPRPNTTPSYPVYTRCPSHLRPESQLVPEHWQLLLAQYPDPSFIDNIAGIATYGARIGYAGPLHQIVSENHASALRIPSEIDQNIASELAASRIAKIHTLPSSHISSPLGAVPKKANGIQTGWRRIHDLSYPKENSVNDGIPQQFGSLTYQTLDDAIALIAKHRRHTILRKRDLKDAFRRIPVSAYDY